MFWRGLRELARGFGQLLLPNACLICDKPEGERPDFRHGLCSGCWQSVAIDFHNACPRCAATVGPHADTTDGCSGCRGHALGFAEAMRLGPYDGRLRDAILRMKSLAGEGLAESLGEVAAEILGARIRDARVDLIVPIPLHWRRWWQRGYNQSEAVARELGAELKIEVATRALRRVNHSPQHLQPSAAARRENVRGAFRVRRGARVADRIVLLVDDVMTTGSTATEAAKTLKDAGARRVLAAVLARD